MRLPFAITRLLTLPDSRFLSLPVFVQPDVAAMSNNVPTVLRGETWPAGGTSCSSPIFSGVVALLNDARMMAGKQPLGFLNQMLYQLYYQRGVGNFTQDIVRGNNPGCNTNGFVATRGWDAVTGLGTPAYPLMLEAVLNLP